ncbi:PorT family protein, partial [Fulvivirga sp. RKSG066]|uniref:porin family protein n=1 Tax=Fulvivirga aurantia TaxID=2529383 RepID=UPI0012BC1604
GANAQVALGVKGGLNFANVSVEDAVEDPDSKTGYHFGAFAEIGLGGIHLQPELLFSAKGSDDFDLTYLEIPILLKKNFAKVLNVHLGPQFGFLTSAESNDVDIKDGLKSSDLSAVVGAGVNLPAGLTGGVRYVFGLSDIDDNAFETEIKNKTLQLYVGWKFAGN